MRESKKYINFILEQLFFGIIMWIYVSFLMKLLLYYINNFLVSIFILILMGTPVRKFIVENSVKSNAEIFNKNTSIIQDIIILATFISIFLILGNACEYVCMLK